MTVSSTGFACFARSACIKCADIEAVSIEDTYIRYSCIGVTSIGGLGGVGVKSADWNVLLIQSSLFDGKGACIKDVSIKDTCDQGAYIGDIFTREAGANAGAIKHLGIDL